SNAFAVGQFGLILHWDGASWSEDPQSGALTQSQLDAVAFGPSGEGWAVGADGTILHYDGHTWSREKVPEADQATSVTSVAVAGPEAFAVAGGNLIRRSADGSWRDLDREDPSQLPSDPAPKPGSLRVVAGLPDGGVLAAGRSVLMVRESAGRAFEYGAQPLQGIAVAPPPFPAPSGGPRAAAAVPPPPPGLPAGAGVPPGDGDLLRQSDTGWVDLSQAQYAGSQVPGDGALKGDPVLAVATGPTGEHAWAAGGYDGTVDAADLGTTEALSTRSHEWQSASIWRYDGGARTPPPALSHTAPNMPAKAGTVSFGFFTSATCREQCA